MKKLIFLSALFLLVSISSINGQGGPIFDSDSSFKEGNFKEEQMDRTTVLTVEETKKANNLGGQGGACGFATFNTNTKYTPIDGGITQVVGWGGLGYGVTQIKKRNNVVKNLNMDV